MPAQPFAWFELLRFDYRGKSPLTERSLIVTPAAPLPLPAWGAGAVVFSYRHDVLTELAARDLDITSGLHRFELGVPTSFSVGDAVSLDVDLRMVYATELTEHRGQGWYPSVRVGPTWRLSESLSLGGAVFWSRGGLGFVPVPLGAIYWRPTELPMRIDALLPRYLEVAWRLAEGVELFSTFHWESHVWAVAQRGPDARTAFCLDRSSVCRQG